MDDYITVVSVDEEVKSVLNGSRKIPHKAYSDHPPEDSSFITVLSINDTSNSPRIQQDIVEKTGQNIDHSIESVVVYRLPGERLGFGLKFQGGTKNDDKPEGSPIFRSHDKVQRLFIQSCAIDSPASRAQASWGYLKEGDEIISIDGQPVAEMTRIECVRCLKESNVAIKLEVRNGDGIQFDQSEDESYKSQTNQPPPPPPPVPPRKLVKRKQGHERGSPRDDKPFTPPPDAEYYINLFSNEATNIGECESDDTGSSVSTVVDRFSICSTYSTDSNYSYNSNGGIAPTGNHTNGGTHSINKAELAKVLKPFTLLEKEFNVDSSAKLEACLKKLEPDSNVSPTNTPKQPQKLYENVFVTTVVGAPETNGNENNAHVYENVQIIVSDAPKPKPRQIAITEPKKRSVLPIPRRIKDSSEDEFSKSEPNGLVSPRGDNTSSPNGKPKDHVSKIPKVSPSKLLRRAKTESDIKFKSKSGAAEVDLKELCRVFLHFESGQEGLPCRVVETEMKSPKSKIPVACIDQKETDVDQNIDTVDFTENIRKSEKSLVLRSRGLIKKQKSETDLKLGSPNTFFKDKQLNELIENQVISVKDKQLNEMNEHQVASPTREQVPSKIAIRNTSPSHIKSIISNLQTPPRNKANLHLNLNVSNKFDTKVNGESSKVNFSIAPMAKPSNDFDEVSMITPIRTKSQIPILSPDANECSFKTFSKDSEKRHIILNIAPDKDRKILNSSSNAFPVKTGNPVPPPVVPKHHVDPKSPEKSQPPSPKEPASPPSQIRFTIQTYEGDKLDNNVQNNDLNHPPPNSGSSTKIPQQAPLVREVDENGNEHIPLPRLIDAIPKNEVNSMTKLVPDASPEFSVDDDDDVENDETEKPIVVGKCIKLMNEEDSNYVLSSSSSSDEDEEKVYEIEDGEKLGPPEVVDGPGPSEAYFNFSWHSNMLPTIGEVEEELSSLETHSRVVIDMANEMSPILASQLEIATRTFVSDDSLNTPNNTLLDIQDDAHVSKGEIPAVKSTTTLITDTTPILTAAIEIGNAIKMTIPAKCHDEENKLAASSVSDKIRTTDGIDEISNMPPQSPPSMSSQGSSSISSIENRGDGDGYANGQLNMSTSIATNEKSVNGTDLLDLSVKSKDPAEIVAETKVQVLSSESLDNAEPYPHPISTKSISMESSGERVSVSACDKRIEESVINGGAATKHKVKDESSNESDATIIEEVLVDKPEELIEANKDANVFESNGISGVLGSEMFTSEPSVGNDLEPEIGEIIFESTDNFAETNDRQRVNNNQPSDKSCTIDLFPLSGKESIRMTQALLNSEREVNRQCASAAHNSCTKDLIEEPASEKEDSLMSTDYSILEAIVDSSAEVIDPDSNLNIGLYAEPTDLLDLATDSATSITGDSNKTISEEPIISLTEDISPDNTGKLHGTDPASEAAHEVKADLNSTISNPIDNASLHIVSNYIESSTEKIVINQIDQEKSKPIERIILGVENNPTILTDAATNRPLHAIYAPKSSENQSKWSQLTNKSDSCEMEKENTKKTTVQTLDTRPMKSATTSKPNNLLGNTKDSNLKMDKIAASPLILNDYIALSSPPTYSRLPPDGHEFPPNFSEPMIIPVKSSTALVTDSKIASKQTNPFTATDQSNSLADCPPLPKSVPPPTVPRKVYRQDLIIKVDDARTPEKNEKVMKLDQGSTFTASSPLVSSSFEASRTKSSSINTLHNMDSYKPRPNPVARKLSDWRKDEKSEKSVRDKIAMFSSDDRPDFNKTSSKSFNKSIENLLDSSCKLQPFTGSLTKKAMSVENLNDDYRPYSRTNSGFIERNQPESTLYKSDITQSYSSLPRRNISTLTRTTSFSGHDEGSRRASVANILEQRRKSMSKLRGLVIPERPSSNLETIIDLPEIKSKDSEKIKMNGYNTLQTTPRRDRYLTSTRSSNVSATSPSLSNGVYKSIFSSGNRTPATAPVTSSSPFFKKSDGVTLPPAKPPRTSLILSKVSHVEESDSDSVFSSKISSPPMSPRAPVQEKFALTRTLSSETNTSIASSTTSTLTSGSGSQASCSSVGSTPTVDMSRKILKSGSGDSTINRKNILASAKCRSGRDDSSSLARNRRYEDEDSTDGYDEEEIRRAPKLKQRSLSTGSNKSLAVAPAPINYKLVGKDESLVDKIVNVASYVEVTSDTDDSSRKSDSSLRKISAIFIDEERKASFKADPNQKAQTKKPEPAKRSVHAESDDLAKWVQSEAAKAFRQKDMSTHKPTAPERSAIAEKFESLHKSNAEASPRAPIKLKNSTAEIREKFEMRSQTGQSPIKPVSISKTEKIGNIATYHERFSSLDSIASSSSGVSSSTQNLPSNQETPTEFGSFSSFGSNQSLITAQDIQVLIEEADPPLKTPDAFIVVLQRETPESSIGITLAGGSDYEAKEITIHKILGNSPAAKDGRLKKGDRILAINGLSMRGLTHRESITVLKTPRPEVVLVVTRSESVIAKPLSKKRSSLGSLTSLNDKPTEIDLDKKLSYHKASRSLDLDLDIVSAKESSESKSSLTNAKTAGHEVATMNGHISPTDTVSKQQLCGVQTTRGSGGAVTSKISTGDILNRAREPARSLGMDRQERIFINDEEVPAGAREIEILKDNCGLGFSIEGGYDSPLGNRPLVVKKVFWGGAAQKAGSIKSGDEIVCINGVMTSRMTRVDVWNYMKQLPMGPVKIILL